MLNAGIVFRWVTFLEIVQSLGQIQVGFVTTAALLTICLVIARRLVKVVPKAVVLKGIHLQVALFNDMTYNRWACHE